MKIEIGKITVLPDRRPLAAKGVDELVESMAQVGLLNPITVDRNNNLIAGRHRLEAAKLLGWTDIECNVTDLEGLEAELAEIDENFVRTPLTTTEKNDLLLRRKEIYEALHPETKAGVAQAAAMNRALGNNVETNLSFTSKSFVQDTAEKLGVSPSTVKRQIQSAKNTTAEAKEIIRSGGIDLTQQDALRLSQLEPDEQRQAAEQLVSGEVKTVGEYLAVKPKPPVPGPYDDRTHEEKLAYLYTMYMDYAQGVLNGLSTFSVAWDVFPEMRQEELDKVLETARAVCTKFEDFIADIESEIGIE